MTDGRPALFRWLPWMLLILLAIPIVMMFFLPSGGWMMGGLWFWIILAVYLAMIGMFTMNQEESDEKLGEAEETGPRMLLEGEQPAIIREVMNVRVALEDGGTRVFRGRLREPASVAFSRLKQASGGETIPLIQPDEQLGTAIVLLPEPVERATLERPVHAWLHWLLFAITIVTTTWAGARHQGINLVEEPERFAVGLPYSIGLMAILGVHELGHYLAARYHGMRVTPPYFIPVPFALGTFGAFIQMKSPAESRRSLFDVAIAGPLAGLIVAIPALILGLQSSQVMTGPAVEDTSLLRGASVGSSLMFAGLARLALGEQLQYGHTIQLGPLAFAGWLGLLVTGLNLLPIGQLDGGHIARSMFGSRVGSMISSVGMWSLFLLAIFIWPGLLFWAMIVFFIAGRGTPPLNDVTPIRTGRKSLGFVAFLLLAGILLPLPHALWHAAGIYCPYL